MIFAPGLQFIMTGLLLPVPLNAVEWSSQESTESYGRAITATEKKLKKRAT